MIKKISKFLMLNLIFILSFIIFNHKANAWYIPYGSITVYYTDTEGNELHEKDFSFGKMVTIPIW